MKMKHHTEGQATASKNRNNTLGQQKRISELMVAYLADNVCWMMNEQGGLSTKTPTPH